MKAAQRLILACLLASFCGAGMATPPRTEFEQSFIGREWTRTIPDVEPNTLSPQCKYVGGYAIVKQQQELEDYDIDSFICDGRRLHLLTKSLGFPKVKIIDALLLPRFKLGDRLMESGDCELDGKHDTTIIVLVHLGQREKVDWKTGVRAAWMPMPETGKIEELPVRRVVCWRPTPP